jgi:Rieske Fe-S protein
MISYSSSDRGLKIGVAHTRLNRVECAAAFGSTGQPILRRTPTELQLSKLQFSVISNQFSAKTSCFYRRLKTKKLKTTLNFMPEKTDNHTSHDTKSGRVEGRRNFLLLVPLGVFAAVAGTLLTAAFRFLHPHVTTTDAKWSDVAPLSELQGERPLMRSIVAEHDAGWASTREEHFVYVLPNKNHQVLSGVCTHEGCNVSWRDDTNGFYCPCHDSYFAADGEKVSGPALRGLDPLPTRTENGVLQVQYRTFVNNTEERIVRG